MRVRIILIFLAFGCLFSLASCNSSERSIARSSSPAMVVSVSSDGQYAISSHQNNKIVLWDIADQARKDISTQGNIYSAYFIRNSDMFMWQDLNDIVHVEKIDGKEIKSFKHISTYGHVMTTDLEHYISSDIDWGIYHGYGDGLKVLKKGEGGGYIGGGKLINLTLSDNGRYLTMSGYSYQIDDRKRTPKEEEHKQNMELLGVTLWDVATQQPISKLSGNSAKTNATISPDGRYVVSGCENAQSYMWEVSQGKKHRLASIYDGVWKTDGVYDASGMIPKLKEIKHDAILNIQFVKDSEYYLRFFTYEPYVALFSVKSPFPLKYLPLGRDPFPSVNAYDRNAAIDTAPAVGILVTGQARGGGINVYQYHPDKQDLEKVWVAK